MADLVYLPNPAPAWFYAVIEWIRNLKVKGNISSDENYFLID
jgi:hypothetical protein